MATFFDYIFLLNEINQAQIELQRQKNELRDNVCELQSLGLITHIPTTMGKLREQLKELQKQRNL